MIFLHVKILQQKERKKGRPDTYSERKKERKRKQVLHKPESELHKLTQNYL